MRTVTPYADSNSQETQSHIFECKKLIRPSEIVTFLPNYRELFGDDIEAQVDVPRLIKDNHGRIVVESIIAKLQIVHHVNWLAMLYCYLVMDLPIYIWKLHIHCHIMVM